MHIILNIVTKTVLGKGSCHGSQGSSEHGYAGLLLGQSGLHCGAKAEEELRMAASRWKTQVSAVTAESHSPSFLLGLLKGRVYTNKMIMAAVRVGELCCHCPLCLSAQPVACVWLSHPALSQMVTGLVSGDSMSMELFSLCGSKDGTALLWRSRELSWADMTTPELVMSVHWEQKENWRWNQALWLCPVAQDCTWFCSW